MEVLHDVALQEVVETLEKQNVKKSIIKKVVDLFHSEVSINANDINDSTIVQGNIFLTLIQNNEDGKVKLSEQDLEILRMLSELDVTDRAKVLVYAARLKNRNNRQKDGQ